jgi:hypothetical protein
VLALWTMIRKAPALTGQPIAVIRKHVSVHIHFCGNGVSETGKDVAFSLIGPFSRR